MYRKPINWFKSLINRRKAKGKTKIFCIGRNKTGTTSLKKAFEDLGYPVGRQEVAEQLTADHYFTGEFDRIIDYCNSAQVFQDIPFSYPKTYQYLDKAYPNSKFILTVRDDEEQWYRSVTRFHAKLFGRNGNVPTFHDLQRAKYIRQGFMTNITKIHGTTDLDPYNKDIMTHNYLHHNDEIIQYFKDRPDDLLVINIADKGAYAKFAKFLDLDIQEKDFPWENKT